MSETLWFHAEYIYLLILFEIPYTGCGIGQLTAEHFVGGHILGN
jgi:hypothetical protein